MWFLFLFLFSACVRGQLWHPSRRVINYYFLNGLLICSKFSKIFRILCILRLIIILLGSFSLKCSLPKSFVHISSLILRYFFYVILDITNGHEFFFFIPFVSLNFFLFFLYECFSLFNIPKINEKGFFFAFLLCI